MLEIKGWNKLKESRVILDGHSLTCLSDGDYMVKEVNVPNKGKRFDYKIILKSKNKTRSPAVFI